MNHNQSHAMFEEARTYIPGGVNSPVRSFANVDLPPVFIDHAYGSHVVDVDGNDYLDYIGSWGPMILGHAHPLLTQGSTQMMEKGISYGLCTPKEIELAKRICHAYSGMDMVRMVNSGTEATMSAIRVARCYTGKDKVIKFEGCYHGHSDGLLVKSGSGALTFGVPTSPGVPKDVVKNTIVCTYNDLASVQSAIAANPQEIAAIILEPIAGNMGVIPASKTFIKGLRALCDEHKIVLIFDEVISGFRVRFDGAAGYYGVTPDMACFGKIIGAGLPVGAYGGKREIMDLVSPAGPVYQAGTLSGNPLAMELGCRLLAYLEEHPDIYDQLDTMGNYMKEQLTLILQDLQLPYQIHQVGSLMTLFFMDYLPQNYHDVTHCDRMAYTLFFKELFNHKILIAPSPFEAMFLSSVHTKEEISYTLQSMEQALKKVKEYVF